MKKIVALLVLVALCAVSGLPLLTHAQNEVAEQHRAEVSLPIHRDRTSKPLREMFETGERPEPEELEGATAYAIAARIELPPETKQQLLEMRDEDERMTLLANALGAVGKALERAEEAAERASGNGKVHLPGLPD